MKNYLMKFCIVFFATSIVSCKKEDPKPPVVVPPVVTPSPALAKEIFDIELYNQVLDTIKNTGKKFYNITTQTYSNSVNFPIELAYVYFEGIAKTNKHIIGCASANSIKGPNGIPPTNNTKVDFYAVNDGNSPTLFDTIKYSASIGKVFNTSTTLSTFQGESNAIGSDGFGWDKNKIIGFKLGNGKRGFLKLTIKPTGSQDDKGVISPGKIIFNVKMEE